jgi:type II secretion system protein N
MSNNVGTIEEEIKGEQTLPPPANENLEDNIKSSIANLGALKTPSSAWNEEEPPKVRKKNVLKKWLRYSALAASSFVFFLYLTFPYGVLKEVIVDRVTQEIQKSGLPIRLSIETLDPYWITGIQLKNLTINNVTMDSVNLKLSRVRLYVNPFALLIGRVSVSLNLNQGDGSASVKLSIPITTLMNGHPSPRSANIELKNFAVDPFFTHALAIVAGSKDPGMLLIAPLVSKTSIGGKLTGQVSFANPNPEHFGDATGNFEVSVGDGFLHINDQTLKIRKQSFKTASLDLKFEGNALVVGKGTRFAAEDIEFALDGKFILPDLSRQATQAELNFELTMRDKIQESLGFIVPNMLRCPALTEGVLKASLSGPVTAMTCTGN